MANPLDTLIDPDAEVRLLGDGFEASEGPVWNGGEGCLYFSDIPADVRWRWSEAEGMVEAMHPNFKGNGLVYDAEGNLLVCEQVTSSVARYRPTGERDVLAFHLGGKYLNSPNDIVTRGADRMIYFTDPDYGRWNDWIGIKREGQLGYRGVMRVGADGGDVELMVAMDEFDEPNGLCFSPDESLLYVNDSGRGHIKVFDIAPDGSLSGGRMFFEGIGTGDPNAESLDGMKCDEHGNVWVTGPGGIWIIDPASAKLGVVPVPDRTLNLTWGGPEWRTLFITCLNSVHTVETRVVSAPLPYHGAWS